MCLDFYGNRDRDNLAGVVTRHLQLSQCTVTSANTLCLNALGTKDTVSDTRAITVVAQSQDLLATEHRHERFSASISVTTLVFDAEEALQLKPDFLEHGTLVGGVGEGAATVGSVAKSLEGNVDRVGEVESIVV